MFGHVLVAFALVVNVEAEVGVESTEFVDGFCVGGVDEPGFCCLVDDSGNLLVSSGSCDLVGDVDECGGLCWPQTTQNPTKMFVQCAVSPVRGHVGPVGLEPTTHGLKVRCSTN